MKRKNYILLIAAAMLASSCANDDVIDTSAKVEMKFRVTADSPTRAAAEYCSTNIPTKFTICCFSNGNKVPVFSYEGITKNGEYWTLDNANYRYWSANTGITYNFVGTNAGTPTMPSSESQVASASYNESADGFHFLMKFDKTTNNYLPEKRHIVHTVPAEASAQKDLLFAYTSKNSNQVTNGVVTLNFAHMLSKVVFQSKVTDKHLLVEIDEVKVCNVYTKGRFEMVGRTVTATDGNFENHTSVGTAPSYLDQLDKLWYASSSYRANNDSQHSEVGTRSTGNFGIKAAPANASGVGVAVNLTDTDSGSGHLANMNSANNALLLIPQVTNAWNPTANPNATTQTTGSYFLVKCRIWDVKSPGVLVVPDPANGITSESSVELWPNKTGVTTEYIAIPFAADWKLGRKYVYTFVFGNSGGFGGYDPTTGNKVLLPIKLTCSVHDFVNAPVSGDLDR